MRPHDAFSSPHRSLYSQCFVFSLVLFTPHFHGQQNGGTYSVKVKVVNVPVTVRDKHGEIKRDLAKDDFMLGRRRPRADDSLFFHVKLTFLSLWVCWWIRA